MAIKINGKDVTKRIINGKEVVKTILNEKQIWPESTPPAEPDYLCFSLVDPNFQQIGITLTRRGQEPSPLELQTSYDKENWEDYTVGTTKQVLQYYPLYFRSKSTTPISAASHRFVMESVFTDGVVLNVSGDPGTLLCKDSTTDLTGLLSCFSELFAYMEFLDTDGLKLPATTLEYGCYSRMFASCRRLTHAPSLPAMTVAQSAYGSMFSYCQALVTPPSLPATTISEQSYAMMFNNCTELQALPALPALDLYTYSYSSMFEGCSKIKISETQVDEYQTPYRVPISGTGVDHGQGTGTRRMFNYTGGTYKAAPVLNRTYYTSNQIV